MGIEPTTTGITIRDSTTELQPPSEKLQITQVWKPEANCFKNLLACPTGIEPVTPSLEGWCSIRLSYGHHSNRAYPESIGQNWSGWRDLNSRHPGPKPGALPGYATPRKGRHYTFPLIKGQFSCLFYPVYPNMKESEKQGSISKPNKEIRFKDLRSKSFLERKIFLYPTFLSVVNPTRRQPNHILLLEPLQTK